jgi:hypothetical protein
MSETFRSKVEEIEACKSSLPRICRPKSFSQEVCDRYNDCVECHTDRICAALKERVEKVESLKIPPEGATIDVPMAITAWNNAVDDCKSYMLEGLDG